MATVFTGFQLWCLEIPLAIHISGIQHFGSCLAGILGGTLNRLPRYVILNNEVMAVMQGQKNAASVKHALTNAFPPDFDDRVKRVKYEP